MRSENTPQLLENKPHVRLADGYEELAMKGDEGPDILLTLGSEQSLLSPKEAQALATALIGMKFVFWNYASYLKQRSDTVPDKNTEEVVVPGEL